MLQRIIDDIRNALDHDCLFSALALALTLPDICGKAQYPDEKASRKRYIAWYDEHVGRYEKNPDKEPEMPYLSGEVVYSLRCCFLHQGTPNIEQDRIKEQCCIIDHFSLLTEKKNEFDLYGDCATHSCNWDGSGMPYRTYEVSIRRLCLILTACARGYYKENQEKFDFFQFSIVDADNCYASINPELTHF